MEKYSIGKTTKKTMDILESDSDYDSDSECYYDESESGSDINDKSDGNKDEFKNSSEKKNNKLNKKKENNPINLLKFFTTKELYYYKMIDRFYKTCSKDKIKKMLEIIEGTSEISLRVLDWFVTRYSKKNIIVGEGTDLMEIFDVHISYKAQLKSYRKKYFDPFRRRKKFDYSYDAENPELKMSTTLGQLNFFYWAMIHGIIEYIEKNLDNILKEMNTSLLPSIYVRNFMFTKQILA